MIIYPAIDLRAGRCVRLKQGDFQQETVYGSDPGDMAASWQAQGATALHLVDLDGAKSGRPINLEALRIIRRAVTIPLQLGGGLRSEEDLNRIFELGIERAILGSRACQDRDWLQQMSERYAGRIVLGLDSKAGYLATDGWLQVSKITTVEFAQSVSEFPLAGIIYTDIARDGMLAGPDWNGLAALQAATTLPIIASGGVTTVEDVQKLREMQLAGCIIGKALYESKLLLKEIL
ncbi:MAG TPA: 1-(5-phosphoribosyl)-5-[(5-phosphoribosylamino)methylideneamino]imidazole-4-carboxamide isomerase [Gemmatales bacterium]|nr:1-(5-phosphoribosyl)-5-[(5-phosphoribosylamino)methylideneamino]imidazole-4-carboxamide isomerase [Gemmatales bacterium]